MVHRLHQACFTHTHTRTPPLCDVCACSVTDSYGYVDPSMEALWNLGKVVSSEVMLRKSNESTLYNLAQVASIKQLVRRALAHTHTHTHTHTYTHTLTLSHVHTHTLSPPSLPLTGD